MSLGGSLTEGSAVHVPDLDHNAGPETSYAQLDSELACGLIRGHCLIGREALYHTTAHWTRLVHSQEGALKSEVAAIFSLARQCGSMGHTVVVLTCVTTMEA